MTGGSFGLRVVGGGWLHSLKQVIYMKMVISRIYNSKIILIATVSHLNMSFKLRQSPNRLEYHFSLYNKTGQNHHESV